MTVHAILVVDDEEMTRNLLRLMLQPAGYKILEAGDGLEALAVLTTKQDGELPAVVILDVMMPNMDGIETCQKIRSNPDTAHLPVIMLSAKTYGTAIEEGIEAGANYYLTKPIARKQLLETIHLLLNHDASPDI